MTLWNKNGYYCYMCAIPKYKVSMSDPCGSNVVLKLTQYGVICEFYDVNKSNG